jgi:tetratricopeptide (TPR) repeat protein
MPNQAPRSQACPCDSGLTYTKCCGRKSKSRKDTRRNNKRILLLYADAWRAFREGRSMHCLSAVKEILEEQPYHGGAMDLLFRNRNPLAVFSPKELIIIAGNILDGHPDNSSLRCSAADVFELTGQIGKAVESYQHILKDSPYNFRAHFGLGRASHRRHQLDQAEFHFRLASYIRRKSPQTLRHLATTLSALGRKAEAEHHFKIALAQSPLDAEILLHWTQMEESRGNLEQAWKLYRMVPEKEATFPARKVTEAVLHRRQGNNKKSLVTLDEIDASNLPAPIKASYWYERCYTLDKLAMFDQAFDCASRANAIKEQEQGLSYDEEQHKATVRKLKQAFVKKRIAQLKTAKSSPDEEGPIFICGFTRSGTSMVEQILSAHPDISGGDELPFVYDLASNASSILDSRSEFPDCLFETTNNQQLTNSQLLRQHYLERLRLTGAIEPGVRRITDKMPMNELHLGLIHLMFPGAKVVHVVRHPLDAVLSTYFTDATHGGFCGYNLMSAAKHYKLLADITSHYLGRLDIDYLRIRYEDIVKNVDREVRRLLRFLDQPFDQRCVEFHRNPRFARTASYAQVTEKLYDRSAFRYRNYKEHLDPIAALLEPVVQSYGYRI